ncbi:MAG: FAD binding domain-containing protein [Alicyclobacillus sp.]|nr:FAD binding domain-containing protein [Alicyclobacillus sp.]
MAWYQPNRLEEAVKQAADARTVVVCGGTDLFVNWARRQGTYGEADWMSVERIPELQTISLDDTTGDLVIGAAVTAHQIASHGLCAAVPALQQAARVVGGWQIQNRASIGGNLVNASPAADMAVPLVAYDAVVALQSLGGRRRMPVRTFLRGPRQTALEPGELLTEVRIPARVLGRPQQFLRLDQRGGTDISLVSAAAVAQVDEGRVSFAQVAVGAANPVPFSLPEVDASLQGLAVADGAALRDVDGVVASVARRYAEAAQPISDVRASAAYRTAMVDVLVRRAIAGTLTFRAIAQEVEE